MNNKRITIVLGVLLVILAIGYYLNSDFGGPSGGGRFAISDTASIDKIILSRHLKKVPDKPEVVLERKGNHWMANNLYVANPKSIRQLLSTITHVQSREQVDVPARKNALKYIEEGHVKVEIHYEGGTHIYYIGPSAPDRKGSLAKLEGGTIPHIIEIPGFQGSIDRQFASDIKNWRELPLFSGTHQTLRTVSVRYKGADSSFVLKRASNGIWKLSDAPTDTSKTMAYMQLFRTVNALEPAEERYAGKFEELRDQQPDALITLTDKDKKKTELRLYYWPEKPDLYLGWVSGNNELLLIQHFVLNRFLADKKDFTL